MKMIVALLLVCLTGIGALYQVSDGFRVVTSEEARRLSIVAHPRAIPDARLQLASGASTMLSHALRTDGRVTIVNFIYTRCNTICSVMGHELQQLQARIHAAGLDRRIRLLSLSFDPNDTPAQLSAYAQRMQAQANLWQFATLRDAAQRQALLTAFGIILVPAPLGEFEHNAAFHILDADGRLARIVDFDAPELALHYALEAADQPPALDRVKKPR